VTPDRVMAEMWAQGISVRLATDGRNLAVPAGRLDARQRALLVAQKAALVGFLMAAHETTTFLLSAAMRACDHFEDDGIAREEMRAACLATPPHLRHDLLQHLIRTYPERPRKSQEPPGTG
jgi:hypothetical protein